MGPMGPMGPMGHPGPWGPMGPPGPGGPPNQQPNQNVSFLPMFYICMFDNELAFVSHTGSTANIVS